jgi:hypothetical protein
MENGLDMLADELGVSGRTLRRGAALGWVRVVRKSERVLWLFSDERRWLLLIWPSLAPLRARLRTMPEIRLAVLYGAAAHTGATGDEPLELIVSVADDRRLYALARTLREACGREVRLCSLRQAREDHPEVLVEALATARVLRDPGREWASLRRLRHVLHRGLEVERRGRTLKPALGR